MAGLKREIAQERPFSSKEEEAFLNLLGPQIVSTAPSSGARASGALLLRSTTCCGFCAGLSHRG